MGLIGWSNRHVPVDEWVVKGDRSAALAYCDLGRFLEKMGMSRGELATVVGESWLVRFDSDSHIYHASVRCTGVSLPVLKRPTPDSFARSLVLYFDPPCQTRYSLAACLAMARNGNPLFFDLLLLAEVEERVASSDPRFIPEALKKTSKQG